MTGKEQKEELGGIVMDKRKNNPIRDEQKGHDGNQAVSDSRSASNQKNPSEQDRKENRAEDSFAEFDLFFDESIHHDSNSGRQRKSRMIPLKMESFMEPAVSRQDMADGTDLSANSNPSALPEQPGASDPWMDGEPVWKDNSFLQDDLFQQELSDRDPTVIHHNGPFLQDSASFQDGSFQQDGDSLPDGSLNEPSQGDSFQQDDSSNTWLEFDDPGYDGAQDFYEMADEEAHGLELNPSQRAAVEATEGYVRVIAGAGSGKTRALSERFAYLVQDLGVMPGSILCVTFTNKSANEMKHRIHQRIGDFDTAYICTFHGFCNTVLLEESHAIHYPKSFMVLDNTDIDSFLKIIYEERGLTLRHMTFSKARDMIEIKKIKEIPDYYCDLINLSQEQLRQKYLNARNPDDIIFYGYLYQERKNFALDYNDLILLTLHIFKENPDIANKWMQRLEYIMIDEFQDIDGEQYKLMDVLQQYHKNLFVVGDPDQTIYSWRGANPKYLLNFDQKYPGTQTLFLNENYRSSKEILDSANKLISVNTNRIHKDLVSQKGSMVPVRAAHFATEVKEAQGIAKAIEHYTHKGYALKDIAVLYRAHYMSRPLEDALIQHEIPYTIYSGVQFFQRIEIKDALAYLRMLVFRSDLDFTRTINTPKRNIGKTRMDFLNTYAAENHKSLYESLKDNLEHDLFKKTQAKEYVDLIEHFPWQNRGASEVLSEVLHASGYEAMMRLQGSQERLDNLAELKQAASEYERTAGEDVDIEAWLRHMALFTNTDRDMAIDKVKMMTIHTAKGLEFPVVILPGFNEGLFPSSKTRSSSAMEEERRLAFVAVTRAKNELLITDAGGQGIQGAWRYPSRFLLEMEPALLWEPKPEPGLLNQTRRAAKMPLADQQKATLQPGDQVRHKVFGIGTVMEVDASSRSYLVHFDKLQTMRRLSFTAPLQKTGSSSLSSGLN